MLWKSGHLSPNRIAGYEQAVRDLEIEVGEWGCYWIVGQLDADRSKLSKSPTSCPQGFSWKASLYGGKLRPEQDW